MTPSDKKTRIAALEQRPDVTRLAENLYVISGKNDSRFPYCNAFLITGPENVLIDTGIGGKRLSAIDALLPIDRLLISHPHPDHIAGWDLFKDRHLMVPEQTTDAACDLLKLGTRFTGSVENGHHWVAFAENFLGLVPLKEPDETYGDGAIFTFGRIRLEAIHVPGHIDDHYCFFEHNSKTLLSTDIDFSAFGPWYGNPESAIRPFRAGIEKVMALPCRQVCSSHKPPIIGNAEDEFKSFLSGFTRHRKLVFSLCDPPKTLEEMVQTSPFYQNRMPDKKIQSLFERNLIEKNLELMKEEGLVGYRNGRYYRVH